MAAGGFLDLVNGTPYDWVVTSISQHHIQNWTDQFKPDGSFMKIPKKGGTARLYIDWDTTDPGTHIGDAEIRMEGPNYTFILHARSNHRKHIWVEFRNFSVQGYGQRQNKPGTALTINWVDDLAVAFILSGDSPTNFFPTNGPVSWMQASLPSIGDRPLRKICMPGSNNSGMCQQTGPATAFADDDNSATQWRDIHGQLVAGARYFDIRPCIGQGNRGKSQIMCGCYSNTGEDTLLSWQGMNGLYLQDVIDQVNQFLEEEGNKELVIINLSRGYNTDEGYRTLNAEEWDKVFAMLTDSSNGLEYLWKGPIESSGSKKQLNSLWDITLNELIGKGTKGAAVVVVSESYDIAPDSPFANRGIFNKSQGDTYKSETGSDSYGRIEIDQLEKMKKHGFSNPQLFQLAWTATLTCEDDLDSILRIRGDELNMGLYSALPSKVNPQTFPNILLVDCVGGFNPKNKDNGRTNSDPEETREKYFTCQGRNLATLAMAINWLNTWNDCEAADLEGAALQARWDKFSVRVEELGQKLGEYDSDADEAIMATPDMIPNPGALVGIRKFIGWDT
ncbi:hypothetical protein H072_717 [Dactylellina haptotyla CBS 200.50]|uniref:Uncharacterized protein n=1 Tax=Dactylellina haptotyla (strain CBS 200.50) TaxID=1284197 RepID=S8CC47_DACHA|nr:hypothetical protein H072_717 [Dactylellina haptotyla CBS 200.50]